MSRVFTRSRVAVALSLLMVLSLLALPASGAPSERGQERANERAHQKFAEVGSPLAAPDAAESTDGKGNGKSKSGDVGGDAGAETSGVTADVDRSAIDLTALSIPQSAIADLKAQKAEVTYIVIMDDLPVVAYDGRIRGLAATAPRGGQKIDPTSPKVVRYMDHLAAGHDAALAKAGIGVAKKLYSYGYAIDAFAARMTGHQAAELAGDPMVIAVVEDEKRQLETISTPDFLGMTGEGGMWQVGGLGEDVIIGIVDSGIWPEHPSLSDRTGENPKGKSGKLDYRQIPGWHGRCVPGEGFDASMCNQKLIGAQFYVSGFESYYGVPVQALLPYEYLSPRDVDGHGTHTATTAGGNQGVAGVIDDLEIGDVSGMAPRARIAAYKACWGFGGDDFGGCFTADTVAAIDQAVADGVDVINYSISGTRTNFLDPVEVAFLFAADAGVFVAASAGNSGPGSATVAHPSPWITTVAAGTHDRYFEAEVELGDGSGTLVGASWQFTGAGPAPLVYAGDVALDGADVEEAKRCFAETLDPAQVDGKIVLCDRGTIARVAKSAEVARAGGVGMIHGNVGPSSLNADVHSVPTVHVSHIDAQIVKEYLAWAGSSATAEILPAEFIEDTSAPQVAAFSSRGPLEASGDLLKPDIMAPGVDIIAGVSPIGYGGRLFDSLSGTSMSSPHIAGLAAVVAGAYPNWSPAMVKSALMTTADDVIDHSPFDVGSGHVNPTAALDPGLVYDAGWVDYLGFLCGTGQLTAGYCPAIGIDPSDLNQPNIAIGALAGQQTVVRTVTNVGDAGTYNVSVNAPEGVDVIVEPTELTLGKGESDSYTVTFTTRADATIDAYAFGSLAWSDGEHHVESTLVVRPVEFSAPAFAGLSGTMGSVNLPIAIGVEAVYSATTVGLSSATTVEGNVLDDPANNINVALGTGVGVTFHFVDTSPAGARVALFDDATSGQDDLDLYVFDYCGSFLGGSGSVTSAEQVDGVLPCDHPVFGPGLTVVVHGWETDGPSADYDLYVWDFGGDSGELTTALSDPVPAFGVPGYLTVSWDVVNTYDRYAMGAVVHTLDGTVAGVTVLEVNP